MDVHDEPGTFFRLSHGGREVGWGEALGGGKARIANDTGHGPFAFGDVVEYSRQDGGPRTIVRRLGSLAKLRPAKPA